MRSSDAGPAVFHWLVGDRELPQVAAHHLCLQGEGQLTSHTHKATPIQSLYLDLHLVEGLSLVDAHNAPNHLRDNDHVAQVGLHTSGFLHGRGLLLGLAQSLDQCQWLSLQACRHVEYRRGSDVTGRYGADVVEQTPTHTYSTARSSTASPTSGEPAARAGADEAHQLLVGHVEQLVQVHAAVRELPERPLLLEQLLRCRLVLRGKKDTSLSSRSNIPPPLLVRIQRGCGRIAYRHLISSLECSDKNNTLTRWATFRIHVT